MQELVEQIIQNTQIKNRELKPKQLFFRQFDIALGAAGESNSVSTLENLLEKMVHYGQRAGISAAEIAYRKKTVYWTYSRTNH